MLMDVYALQQIHGANMSTRSGDTVYGFNSNAGGVYDFSTNSIPALTIWDGGGTDTLDVSGYSNTQVINLVSGSFSNIGGRTSNISIAVGAVIENAVGGSGRDTFYLSNGNTSNLINGGSGSDTVYTTYSIGSYTIQAGSTAANLVILGSAGTDSFQNIEYLGFADGTTISTATLFSNRAPTVAVQNVSTSVGQSILASSMITAASDPDVAAGDAITKYAFRDTGSGGGYFTVNGVAQSSGQWIEVSTANLATLRYVGGSAAGSETFNVGVHDGDVWSATVAAVATTTGGAAANRAPTVAVQNVGVSAGQSIAASAMIASASDPDAGDAITKYAFRDTGSGGGYFTVNGVTQASGQWIEVSTANLAILRYVGGATAGSETFNVGVHDGDAWSATVAAVATTIGSAVANRAPSVAVQNVGVSAGQSILASSMITSASDPDAGDAVTKYGFKDLGSGGGYFTVNGVAQASGQWIEVSTANLATLSYVGGSAAGSETFNVGVHDGDAWSPTVAAVVTTTGGTAAANRAPSVAVQNVSVSAGQSILASSMITSVSDPDAGDAVTKYAFKDLGSGGGYFTVNGSAQASGQWIEVTAANLATLRYVGGSSAGGETFNVGVHDGDVWSPTVAAVATTTGSAVANRAPTVSVQNFVLNSGQQFAASSMITAASDPDAGDAITKYAFKDLGSGGGYFTVGGVAQAANQWVEVAAGSLALIAYVGGSSAGSETIYVGAHDGDAWSPSMSLTATTFLLV